MDLAADKLTFVIVSMFFLSQQSFYNVEKLNVRHGERRVSGAVADHHGWQVAEGSV